MHRALLLFPFFLLACGPKTVQVAPQQVTQISVRPRGGQPTFCPGMSFEVEVTAQMINGDVCSTSTPSRCAGSDKALLDRAQVVVTSTHAVFDPSRMVVEPSLDPLVSADGLTLAGWVLGAEQKRATTVLRPIYACMAQSVWDGAPGSPGPMLEVAATIISTPYYPRLTLVRIREAGGPTRYLMAPPGARVRIFARGGDGEQGYAGASGSSGSSGASGGGACAAGGAGGPGGDGQPGGPGGNGGPGGMFVVAFDDAVADELAAQIDLSNPGGEGGSGGPGGSGGAGGQGGSGGPSDEKQCPSGGPRGPNGPSGSSGSPGANGMPGPNGPPPKRLVMGKGSLFAAEMGRIEELGRMPKN